MNIIITGIAGFVGSSLTERLISNKKIKIIGVDNLSYGNLKRLNKISKNIHFIKKDITKLKAVEFSKFGRIYAIIHLAAIAPLPDNQVNPIKSINTNVGGTANMLEIARSLSIKKFIFMSSGAVYERSTFNKSGYSEDDLLNPILLYPTSKYFGEKLCDIFSQTYNLPVYKIRLFNLYGPLQDYKRKHKAFLADVFNCLIKNKVMTIYNTNNSIKRDYLFIDDLVNLFVKLLSDKFSKKNITINACSGESFNVSEIIKAVEKITNMKLKTRIAKKSSNFWHKYENLHIGKYKIKKEIISNEVFKKAEGNPKLFKKIMNKKTTALEVGLLKCFEYAKNEIIR